MNIHLIHALTWVDYQLTRTPIEQCEAHAKQWLDGQGDKLKDQTYSWSFALSDGGFSRIIFDYDEGMYLSSVSTQAVKARRDYYEDSWKNLKVLIYKTNGYDKA